MAKKGSTEISEYVGLLTYAPNNYQKWKMHYLVHAKAKFGVAAQALSLGRHLTFRVEDLQPPPSPDIVSEYTKELVKMNINYQSDKPKVLGDLILHLSEDSAVRVRGYQPDQAEVNDVNYTGPRTNYEEAFTLDDFVTIWKLIEVTHLADPSTLATKIASIRKALRDLRQGNMGIEKYNVLYTYKVERLDKLGKKPD